jgi:hypothetical protein
MCWVMHVLPLHIAEYLWVEYLKLFIKLHTRRTLISRPGVSLSGARSLVQRAQLSNKPLGEATWASRSTPVVGTSHLVFAPHEDFR